MDWMELWTSVSSMQLITSTYTLAVRVLEKPKNFKNLEKIQQAEKESDATMSAGSGFPAERRGGLQCRMPLKQK